MNITTNKDFIWIVDDFIYEKDCDKLISIFNERKKLGQTYDRLTSENSNFLQKKDESLSLKIESDFHDWSKESKSLFGNLNTVVKKYVNEYGINTMVSQNLKFDIAKVQKTLPSGGYHIWHVEKSNMLESANRVLVYTVYLNDDFEGGETEFLFQSVRCKPKKGRICLFPAAFPYVHRGNPPLNGEKYILTSWIMSPYVETL